MENGAAVGQNAAAASVDATTKGYAMSNVKGTIEMATLVTKASISFKYFTKQKDLSITLKLWAKAVFGPWHEAYSRKIWQRRFQ